MILWTIVDIETVMSQAPEGVGSPLENAVLDGVPVLVKRTEAGERAIERVLSTDPRDFLRPELTPGTRC